MDRADDRLGEVLERFEQSRERQVAAGTLPDVILPNSLMSAPPLNVRPPPIRTTPRTAASPRNSSIACSIAFKSGGPSALTGGLFRVMTPISPSRVWLTSPLIMINLHLKLLALGRAGGCLAR